MRPEHQKDALARLKTIRGHLDGLISMVEAEKYCPDIMKQVAAVQASLERVNRILLQNHLETCVTEAIQQGEPGAGERKIQELVETFRFTGALTDLRHHPVLLEEDPVGGSASEGRGCACGAGEPS
jgi:DNA-binding FrmR family transcriptional regulator